MTGMRKRNINLKIHNKMTKWIDSLPTDLQEIVKKDVIVTGGCIASMLLGEEVNDYDVYFKTKETLIKVAEHYVEQFRAAQKEKHGGNVRYSIGLEKDLKDSHGRERVRIKVQSAGVAGEESKEIYEYFESQPDEMAGEYLDDVFDQNTSSDTETGKRPFRPVFLSSNAITLSDQIQIIIRFFGGHAAIHENFDFVHCMNYWTFSDGVELRQDALEALMSKTLVYLGSLYPICSVFRTKKFLLRGWNINAGQYLKMMLQISKLNLESFEILEEQLTGVDAAYFSDLLSRARDKNNPERVDSNYLTEIINRMF